LTPEWILNVYQAIETALEKFGGLHLPAHEGLFMATYTSAQALLACGAAA